jgi:hypothetical protein
LGSIWVQKDREIKHHPSDKVQGKGKNLDSDIAMTMEEIPLQEDSRPPSGHGLHCMVQYTRVIHAQIVIIT